jgi:hypothetical protein
MNRTAFLIAFALCSGLVALPAAAQQRSLFDQFEELESTKALRRAEEQKNPGDKPRPQLPKPTKASKPRTAARKAEPLPTAPAQPKALAPAGIVSKPTPIETRPETTPARSAKASNLSPTAAAKVDQAVAPSADRREQSPTAEAERDQQSVAGRKQEEFVSRIQRSDRRSVTSICADGCRGEMRGRTQPIDPFAALPNYDLGDLPTGLAAQP